MGLELSSPNAAPPPNPLPIVVAGWQLPPLLSTVMIIDCHPLTRRQVLLPLKSPRRPCIKSPRGARTVPGTSRFGRSSRRRTSSVAGHPPPARRAPESRTKSACLTEESKGKRSLFPSTSSGATRWPCAYADCSLRFCRPACRPSVHFVTVRIARS